MNLSDLSIKAYSIGINLEVLDILSCIRKIDNTGGKVIVSILSELKYLFEINYSEIEFPNHLIELLDNAIQKLNAKYNFISEYNNQAPVISFVLASGNSPTIFHDQLPLILDNIKHYQN